MSCLSGICTTRLSKETGGEDPTDPDQPPRFRSQVPLFQAFLHSSGNEYVLFPLKKLIASYTRIHARLHLSFA